MDPLRRPPIGFAHRGARAHAPDNTLESFVLTRRLGAAGLDTDVWLTAEVGVDCVNMHHTDWTGGLTTLFHRFERYCFGWDAQYHRVLAALLAMGIDGIYSDHVDRLVEAVAESQR